MLPKSCAAAKQITAAAAMATASPISPLFFFISRMQIAETAAIADAFITISIRAEKDFL